MALSDFYARNANYGTKLNLTVKDSRNEVVSAASAALELLRNEEVQAIIGPQTSNQAKFVASLGDKAQIPIISFSVTSPSLSPTLNRFFIRTALDDSSQIKAITSIVQAYGWHEVVLIHEDTEYGNGMVPYIIESLQQIDTKVSYRSVISPSSSRLNILRKLNKLMAMQTRVFLVHMTPSLGSQLFVLPKDAGMMSEGYAWIVTDGLSSVLHPLEAKVIDSMEGVVGVRPYVSMSKGLNDFKKRWKRSTNGTTKQTHNSKISIFGLWAYDTVWALAKAVELVELQQANYSSAFKKNNKGKSTDGSILSQIGVSESGLGLLQTLVSTKFDGLSGRFKLIDQQLQPAAFEIFNVISRRERVIGYLTPNKESFHDLVQSGMLSNDSSNSIAMDELIIRKPAVWPGNITNPPKGWVIPITGKKLRIGVPAISPRSFKEHFMKIEWYPNTNEPKSFSGFSYDVFVAALERMAFAVPHKLIPFTNGSSRGGAGTYDDLLYQIKLNKFDAVVGDTTITANRTTYVDFTLPYSESGVRMVVRVVAVDKQRKNMWIFLKPLSWDLWLTTGGAFIFTALVVWILEHNQNTEFRGSRQQQVGTSLWFSFSTLVFAHRERVVSNWTRFVLIIWIFVVLILSQSYTASLASMLTVERLQPAVVDVNELRRNGAYVGYQKNSFVRELLTRELKFGENRLKHIYPEDYHKELSKGSKNGGVDAVFDEIPYLKLFLAKHCAGYTFVGPTYKTDGFGFAFPMGSPLVAYVSRAILNVTQDHKKMEQLQRNYFPDDDSKCQDPISRFSSESPSLSVHNFAGLFIITAVISISSCSIYILSKFLYKKWTVLNYIHTGAISLLSKHFHQNKPTDQHIPARGSEASLQMLESFHNNAPKDEPSREQEVSLPLIHRDELDKLLRMAMQEIIAVEMDKAIQRAAVVPMANETNRSTSQSENQVNEVNASASLPAAAIANQDHK